MDDRNLSRRQLARLVSVTAPTVTGWLTGAIPYPKTVTALCQRLGISRAWLLRGEGKPYLNIPKGKPAFQEFASDLETIRKPLADVIELYETLAIESAERTLIYRRRALEAEQILGLAGKNLLDNRIHSDKPGLRPENSALQSSISPLETLDVASPSNVSELLDRVAAATRRPGSKTKLAKMLGVTPQHFSAWLSRKYQPGGDAVLQLLTWVRANEAQQKRNPGGAQTPPGPVTQLRKSREEKPKSGQKKSSHKHPRRSTPSRRPPAQK